MTNALVFKAIFAMDSYNRGYNAAIKYDGINIGMGETSPNNYALGTAKFTRDSNSNDFPNAISAGFYASAYVLENGETIISYRGTDFNGTEDFSVQSGSDVWNGYGLAFGSPNGPQAKLAVEFYKSLTGTGASAFSANVSVVGHSLGAGLGGYVATLYGKKAALFDYMPFEQAAEAAYFGARTAHGLTDQQYPTPQDYALLADIYDGNVPILNNRYGISAYHYDGEFLQAARGILNQQTPSTTLSAGGGIEFPGAIATKDKHSVTLLAITLYGDLVQVGGQWKTVSKYVIPSLYDNGIADAFVPTNMKGTNASSSDVMSMAIAYSAIEEGARPFGDSGIVALFDDMTDMAKLDWSNRAAMGKAIGNGIVENAGRLAINKVMLGQDSDARSGILTNHAGSIEVSLSSPSAGVAELSTAAAIKTALRIEAGPYGPAFFDSVRDFALPP